MAWNQNLRRTPEERLSYTRGWEMRGLAYWQKRAAECAERVRLADSGCQLSRAVDALRMAQEAVRRLGADQ